MTGVEDEVLVLEGGGDGAEHQLAVLLAHQVVRVVQQARYSAPATVHREGPGGRGGWMGGVGVWRGGDKVIH